MIGPLGVLTVGAAACVAGVDRLRAWWRLFPLGSAPIRLREFPWWLRPPKHPNCRCVVLMENGRMKGAGWIE